MQPQKFQNSVNSRIISPYETTQLVRYGLSNTDLLSAGEMPVEYLTGHVDFGGLNFVVNQDVLIPRLETEELISHVLKDISSSNSSVSSPLQILDVGTGSGAIGITLAHRLLQQGLPFSLTLSDISEKALEVAAENRHRLLPLQAPVKLLKSDLLSSLPSANVDVLVANLPYIPSAKIQNLDDSVKDFEPRTALDGGIDGLRLIEKLLQQAQLHLTAASVVWLEIEETHEIEALMAIAPNYSVQLIKDSYDRNRFAKLRFASLRTS